MAYSDYSAHFTYKQLLTYQELNQLGENCDVMYTDATFGFSPVVTRYFSASAIGFVPKNESQDFEISTPTGNVYLSTGTAGATIVGNISIHIPHGATITALKVDWYRDDAAASGQAILYQTHIDANTGQGDRAILATAHSDVITGYHSVTDTSIGSHIKTNDGYSYDILITLTSNDNVTDVQFLGLTVSYTIATPLP